MSRTSDLNKVQLIGRLGADPEVKTLPSGESVANFNVATTEKWKDKKTGDEQSRTEWHRIVAFGGLAKICGDYLKKGSQVYIEGQLRTRKWTDKNNVERYTTEIHSFDMKMLGSRADNTGSAAARPSSRPTGPAPGPEAGNSNKEDFDDDIPF